MNLDVHAPKRFSQRSHPSTETAAWSFSELTGVETNVNVSEVEQAFADELALTPDA